MATPIQDATAAISELNLFPVYSTREDYEARSGKPCPAWDPTLPEKHWEDPAADPDEVVITYKRVIDGPDKPALKKFGVTFEQAARVNIPPNVANASNGKPAIPLPVRDLAEGEELFYLSSFSGPVVKNVKLFDQQQAQQQEKFLLSDRAKLDRALALLEKLAVKEGF